MDLVTFIVISFAVHRVTQLVVWDTVWESSRTKLLGWLAARDGTPRVNVIDENGQPMALTLEMTGRRSFGQFLAHKAGGALDCPYCFGVYTGLGAATWFVAATSVEFDLFWFLVWWWAFVGAQAVLWNRANPERHD